MSDQRDSETKPELIDITSGAPVLGRIEVHHRGPGILIVNRWRSALSYLALGVAGMWNAVALSLALPTLLLGEGWGRWVGAPFLVLGLVFAYAALALLLNRTEITADADWVRVRHRPLPWGRSVSVASQQIARLVVTAQRVRAMHPAQYHLRAMLRDGSRVILLRYLGNEEEARTYGERIEQALGHRTV